MKKRSFAGIILLTLFTTLGAGEWQSGVALNTPRYGAAAVALGGHIYVIGGATVNNAILNSVERYNPATDQWETNIGALQIARQDAAAIVFQGKIYLTGGLDSQGQILEDVEVYDPGQNNWQAQSEEMEEERRGHTMFNLNGTICAIGGLDDDNQYADEIEYFDLADQEWEKAPSDFVSPRSHAFITLVNNQLYIFGGIANVPISNGLRATGDGAWNFNWHTLPNLQQPRGNGATSLLGDSLFIIGGIKTGAAATNKVEIFNLLTQSLENGEDFPTARIGMAAATLNDTIYVIGGYEIASTQPTSAVEMYVHAPVGISQPKPIVAESFAQIYGYPNPFNGEIQLQVRLNRGGAGELAIFDILGKRIVTLHSGDMTAGTHEFKWNGKSKNGQLAASGIYFAAFRQGQAFQQIKIIFSR